MSGREINPIEKRELDIAVTFAIILRLCVVCIGASEMKVARGIVTQADIERLERSEGREQQQ